MPLPDELLLNRARNLDEFLDELCPDPAELLEIQRSAPREDRIIFSPHDAETFCEGFRYAQSLARSAMEDK